MGKTRKRAGQNNKHRPPKRCRDQDESSMIDSEDMSNVTGPLVKIIEQLQPGSANLLCGLQSLSSICQYPDEIPAVLDSDVIRLVAPLVMDPKEEIRLNATGTLRNISTAGEEVCNAIIEQNVLSSVTDLLTEYSLASDWLSESIADEAPSNLCQRNMKCETYVHCIHLMRNMCETSSIALEAFNQSGLITSLIHQLKSDMLNHEIAIAAAQCLLVVSEDNTRSWKELCKFDTELTGLIKLKGDFAQSLLSCLITGIIANVPALAAKSSALLLEVASNILDINNENVDILANGLAANADNKSSKDKILDSLIEMEADTEECRAEKQKNKDNEKQIKQVEYSIEAQRIAVETLTNLCSYQDDEMSEDSVAMESDSDSVSDMDRDTMENYDKLPVELIEMIKALKVVEKLLTKTRPMKENVQTVLDQECPTIAKKLHTLKISSLFCLQNLCVNLSTADFGGAPAIHNLWLELSKQVFAPQCKEDSNLIEALTSLMRATLDHLKGHRNLFETTTEQDLEVIFDCINNSAAIETRANWLKILGTLGCVLPEPLVKCIIDFLIKSSIKDHNAWTLTEGIDALMDIFADNDWHEIVRSLALVSKLQAIDRILRDKLHAQKRLLGDRYEAACTVRKNLQRFLKYLKVQMKNGGAA